MGTESNPAAKEAEVGKEKDIIEQGKASLGIEFGSTRIKAVLIDGQGSVLASGDHGWENHLTDGVWTYPLSEVWEGLQDAYANMKKDVRESYGVELKKLASFGVSAMMHGYLAFNEKNELLVPFRTWRNTITGEAADALTEAFNFNIPQRWSIAHLYQAILNEEPHVPEIRFFTTLAGYVHWQLTGEKVLGVGDAAGMFPIDSSTFDYDKAMMEKFDALAAPKGFPWKLSEILPKSLVAGENAGILTEAGAKLLDPAGDLEAGVPMCPPEGDAGTGMVATNSLKVRTGNVSAGTSVFGMIVLEEPLKKLHRELDMVTTPEGYAVAMAHVNNCTSDINAWMVIFRELLDTIGVTGVSTGDLYERLFRKSEEGDADCGSLLSFPFFSGEHVMGLNEGRPLFVRNPDSAFTLANFMKTHIYSAFGVLKIGMDILLKEEKAPVEYITGHGGIFKTEGVAQRVLAAALDTPVRVMTTASEGGAWGIALLAAYMTEKKDGESLVDFVERTAFANVGSSICDPDPAAVSGYETYIGRFMAGAKAEKAAVENL